MRPRRSKPETSCYADDLRDALEALENRPKPDGCAGLFAHERITDALETVQSHLDAIDPAPVEAAREKALLRGLASTEDACRGSLRDFPAISSAGGGACSAIPRSEMIFPPGDTLMGRPVVASPHLQRASWG